MFRRATAFSLSLLLAGALNVSAAEQVAAPNATPPLIVNSGAVALAESGPEPAVTLGLLTQTTKRPTMLPALYGTFAALQVMDLVSTKKALAAGGREVNPLMRGNMGATIALKAASGTATVYLTEKLWKMNRVAAIVVMIAVNGAGVAIVAHNTRVARQ